MKTLAQSIADELVQMIHKENYVSGMKLPTEKDLCDRFNVGRNTIREALKILASKNIIKVRQGSGSFITETPGLADDPLGLELIGDKKQVIYDLFELLIILEPNVAGMAARNATASDIEDLRDILEEMNDYKLTHADDREGYIELTAKFHKRIMEASHNLVISNLSTVVESGIKYYSSGLRPDSNLYNNFPPTIFKYIENHDAISATSEMRFHLLYDKHMLRKDDDATAQHSVENQQAN